MTDPFTLGALRSSRTHHRFRVWAPNAASVDLHLVTPAERTLAMRAAGRGSFEIETDAVDTGALYYYRLDGDRDRPDPASRHQPRGVRGPSALVERAYPWTDNGWRGIPLEEYIIYELHVGTFSAEGTFDGVVQHLAEICELGVTAIELMPVAQFPGARNWGYDGVFPFAVQDSYGGPDGLRRLVDACHRRGLAVVLDVVYNHIGPDGSCLADFAPYFSDRYRTPWGAAMNFDGAGSDEVRRYFIENARQWCEWYHVDALRLDAVHTIVDVSARPFLQELSTAVGDRLFLIGETNANDARNLRSAADGGHGLHALWNDDFHHALHARLTGDHTGYYQDFGPLDHVEKAIREGFVYTGEYSRFWGRCRGVSSREFAPGRFVVFAQNHDQVGNRAQGERLGGLVAFEKLKLAAATVLLAPGIPLLFMGEEYDEPAPFFYFISHEDGLVAEAVCAGRLREFAAFAWPTDPPDPRASETFARSKLTRVRDDVLRSLYCELIRLRKTEPGLRDAPAVERRAELLLVQRGGCLVVGLNFGAGPADSGLARDEWERRLDSASPRWKGPAAAVGPGPNHTLAPFSAAVFARTN